ncbi:hypothetical protein PUN28_010958 [Cardiocondyla obscurior]|uniref:Uncharacterized protein n=1 Tax=Cardiocondyla obscurior TaxID=286306 RepID=A0AAW2FL20_9HYME
MEGSCCEYYASWTEDGAARAQIISYPYSEGWEDPRPCFLKEDFRSIGHQRSNPTDHHKTPLLRIGQKITPRILSKQNLRFALIISEKEIAATADNHEPLPVHRSSRELRHSIRASCFIIRIFKSGVPYLIACNRVNSPGRECREFPVRGRMTRHDPTERRRRPRKGILLWRSNSKDYYKTPLLRIDQIGQLHGFF